MPCIFKIKVLSDGEKRALEDENSFTLYEYFRALDEIRPKVFFFENVFGFVYKPHKAAFDLLKERAEVYGYDITSQSSKYRKLSVFPKRENDSSV